MKKDVITVTSDTTQMAALGTEAVAAIIANASPYKFEFHAAEEVTGHTVVYAPTGSGMTQQFRPLFDAAQQAMTPEQDFCLATRLAVRRMLGCTSEEAINLVGDPSEYFADGTFTPEQAAAEIIAEAATDSL